VHALVTGELLEELASPRLRSWRARMAAAGVVWELDVVYPLARPDAGPDAAPEVRWLDLAAADLEWLTTMPRTPKLITSICASTLVGLRSGEVTPYRALFTRRVVLKLYAAVDGRIERIGSLADEPIAQALFPTANRRNVDWQLARLGHGAPASARGTQRLPRRL
jgi:hypothetical protein